MERRAYGAPGHPKARTGRIRARVVASQRADARRGSAIFFFDSCSGGVWSVFKSRERLRQSMITLTSDVLATVAKRCGVCDGRHACHCRVKVFTPSGVQSGLCGLGEGENRLTFPGHCGVDVALAQPAYHWIRFASKAELEQEA